MLIDSSHTSRPLVSAGMPQREFRGRAAELNSPNAEARIVIEKSKLNDVA